MMPERTRAWALRGGGWILPLAAASALGTCGTDASYDNGPRPPTPTNVTAAIDDHAISVSPRRFGAGPIVLIVANQSSAAQEITFETDEIGADEPGLMETTSPVNPRGTARVTADVRRGTYELRIRDRRIRPPRCASARSAAPPGTSC